MIENVEEKVIFLPVLNEHGRSLVESGEWRLGLISKYTPLNYGAGSRYIGGNGATVSGTPIDSRFILVHQPKKPKQVCRILNFPTARQEVDS